ncbi:hypothetical protein [Streptococcus oralis]|uniref:Uncharacterized protein n=1 Tax=Streptococcus oralis subsp. oralis TaxID=1891914 RepID=A0ABD6RGD3_STROR|nr:hypothetical protein [Streptococcus oralis]ORO69766.1 hypothetical protein B7711_07985 [Streptococcus oralis subsp. oralis]
MIQKYTGHDRQKNAAREYTEYTKDDPIDIGTDNNPNVIGTVRQVIEDETGIKVYVVESPDYSEVSVLYEGSKEPGEDGKSNLYCIL